VHEAWSETTTGTTSARVAALWTRFERPLVRYAARMVRDQERARDLVQDTFVRLCEADQGEIGDARAWLFRVCRNLAVDHLRRQRPVTDAAELPAADEPADESRAVAEVYAAIGLLPETQQRVLALRLRDGHDYRDISRLTGLSVSHVGVLIHAATKSLRVRLGAAAILVALVVASALVRAPSRAPTPVLGRITLPELPPVTRHEPPREVTRLPAEPAPPPPPKARPPRQRALVPAAPPRSFSSSL
jgi:RNA polymerase sigma factor (sigma-70 family)